MALNPSYEIGRVPRTLVGPDALDHLGALLDGLAGTRMVVVADQGVEAAGYSASSCCGHPSSPGHVARRSVG